MVSGNESSSCSSLAAAALDACVGNVVGGFSGERYGGGVILVACRLWSSLGLTVDGRGRLLGLDLGSGGLGGGGVGGGVLLPAVDGVCDGGCCRLVPLGSGGAGGKKGFGGGGPGGADGIGFVDIDSRVVDIACRVVGIVLVGVGISVSLYISGS